MCQVFLRACLTDGLINLWDVLSVVFDKTRTQTRLPHTLIRIKIINHTPILMQAPTRYAYTTNRTAGVCGRIVGVICDCPIYHTHTMLLVIATTVRL